MAIAYLGKKNGTAYANSMKEAHILVYDPENLIAQLVGHGR